MLYSKLVVSNTLRVLPEFPLLLLSGPLNICHEMLLIWGSTGMFEEALRVFFLHTTQIVGVPKPFSHVPGHFPCSLLLNDPWLSNTRAAEVHLGR